MATFDSKMAGVAMGSASGTSPSDTYDPEGGANNAGMTVGTCESAVRLGFLRKVYSILTLNLLVTVVVACFFSLVPSIRKFVMNNPWLMWLGIALGIGSFLALACIKVKPPFNIVLLCLFVAGFSLMIGVTCAAYFEAGWGGVVLQAFVATFAIFGAITAYCYTTKKDFSFLGGFLLAGAVALITLTLLTFVTSLFASRKASRAMYFGVSLLGALLMTGFLLYDTSLIMTRLTPDEWLLAVILLYTDVTNLFMYLLNILSFLNQ